MSTKWILLVTRNSTNCALCYAIVSDRHDMYGRMYSERTDHKTNEYYMPFEYAVDG